MINFLKRTSTWTNLEFIPFKLCIASIYIIVGNYFHQFFQDYYAILAIVFGITMIWTVSLWFRKMNKNNG